MNGIAALSGALAPIPTPRPTGAEAAAAPIDGAIGPTPGDRVRAIEAIAGAEGGAIDRRADDSRRAPTAFDALRRSFGGDDPVRISSEGRAAQQLERAFGLDPGQADPTAGPRRVRRFDDLFAGPPRPRPVDTAAPGDESTEAPAEASEERAEAADDPEAAADAPAGPRREGPDGEPLTADELEQIRQLEARDAEVRAHEQAHKSVGGRYAGGISYDFQTGPDGQRYAVGGEVPIDIGEVPGDPRATIRKMEIVRRAALAPAQPSGADRAAAAAAGQKAARARVELIEEQNEAVRQAREEAAEAAEETAEADDTPASGDDTAPAAGPERVRPGDGAGIFVKRAEPAIEAPEPAPRRAPGPTVAALRAQGS